MIDAARFGKSGRAGSDHQQERLRAGDLTVAAVDVSVDYGQTWRRAQLSAPVNRFAWQKWQTEMTVPSEGYYEIWSRATDSAGKAQPHVAPDWNPQGYGGNPFHRVAVLIKA